MRASEFFFDVRTARNMAVRVASHANGRRMPMSASGIAPMRSAAFARGGRR